MSNTMLITEIIKCKSGRVAQKWSSPSRLCEYAGTRPFPNADPKIKITKKVEFFKRDFCS